MILILRLSGRKTMNKNENKALIAVLIWNTANSILIFGILFDMVALAFLIMAIGIPYLIIKTRSRFLEARLNE